MDELLIGIVEMAMLMIGAICGIAAVITIIAIAAVICSKVIVWIIHRILDI